MWESCVETFLEKASGRIERKLENSAEEPKTDEIWSCPVADYILVVTVILVIVLVYCKLMYG